MSKTRVVLLIPTLDRSGAEKQFALLATRLPRTEFDVRTIALTRSGPYAEDLHAAGIPLAVIGKRSKFDPFSLWRLRAELKRQNPQILHTWLFAANAYGRLCASAIPRTKIVVSERCIDSWKAAWQLWLDRRLISCTDRLVGNSPGVVEFYRGLGVPSQKLVYIPNGIDVPADSGTSGSMTLPRTREQILAELNLPPDSFVAGFVGRLAKQKRVEDLIWAVETLRQIRPQLRLVIVGDGPERQHLEQLAADVQCADSVRFLGHRNDASELFKAFDVFCLPSCFEGMSNSLMEAMVASRAVIASDIPPNRELVVQGETGFLFKPGDSVGVMQFLRRLMDDPELSARFGRAGRERIERDFSSQSMVNGYAELYRSLISSTDSASHSYS